MAINSFYNYSLWLPDRQRLKRPVYLSLAQQIEEDILNGKLKGGDKLPPQREIADYIGVNFTTVSRAYKQCENKNLIYGVEGSGTFVSPQAVQPETNSMDMNKVHRQNGYDSKIVMGFVSSFEQCNEIARSTMVKVCQREDIGRLMNYENPTGLSYHKEIALHWMSRFGIQANVSDVLITSGAMNAISLCLISLFEPGDRIAVDYYVFFNLIQLAKNLHLQLVPIEGDEAGMLPEQLDYCCENNRIKGIFLMPSCANPTTVFMPIARKNELAAVIQKHGLIVLEDEYFAFATAGYLEEYAVPMRELLPEQTIYLCTTSYAICSGLRIAFMVVPHQYLQTLTTILCNMNVKSPALNAEIVCELIRNGKANEILEAKIELSKTANQLFQKYFPNSFTGHPYSFFRWLKIPKALQADNSIGWQILSKGVHSYYSRRFVCGKEKDERYLRLSLSSADSFENLEQGLKIIAEFFEAKENKILKV